MSDELNVCDESFQSLTMGKKIKTLRINKGWTVSYLARIANMSQSAISRIENDECKHTRKIITFAKIFDVRAELLDNADEDVTSLSPEAKKKFELLKQVFPDWQEIIPFQAFSYS
jgi:transcriptional regulator with XRE-family HTH domain